MLDIYLMGRHSYGKRVVCTESRYFYIVWNLLRAAAYTVSMVMTFVILSPGRVLWQVRFLYNA